LGLGIACRMGKDAHLRGRPAPNGASFVAYFKRCLVPTLKRGDIVTMDSLPVHRVAGVQEAIENCWRDTALSSQILAGSQSDRAGLQQLKAHLGGRANYSPSAAQDWHPAATLSAQECANCNYFSHAGYASK
jgi:hypothetical protein